MKRTTNGHFNILFMGHIPTEQALIENFAKLDAALGASELDPETTTIIAAPTPVAGDIGKVLGVVDDGEGNPVIGWVAQV